MITNTSQTFKDIVQGDGRTFRAKVVVNSIEYKDFRELKVTKSCEANNYLSFGSTVSSQLDITIANVTKDTILNGQKLTLYIGLKIDDSLDTFDDNSVYEWILYGVYNIQKPTFTDNDVKFTAYDNFYLCEQGFFSSLKGSQKTKTIVSEQCTKLGINFVDDIEDVSYNIDVLKGLTIREAFGYLASFLGKNATFNEEGLLQFIWYTDINYTISADRFSSPLDLGDAEYTITGLKCVTKIKATDENGIETTEDNTIEVGTGEYISFSNLYMTQERLQILLNRITGFKIRECSLNWNMAEPHIQVGDIISIKDTDDTIYSIPVMEMELNVDGGCYGAIKSKYQSNTETEYTFNGSLSQQIERTYTELGSFKKVMSDEVNAFNGRFNQVDTDILNVNKELNATKAIIKDLDVDSINAKFAEFEQTKIGIADVETFLSQKAYLNEAQVNTLITQKGYLDEASINTLLLDKGYATEFYVQTNYAQKQYVEENYVGVQYANETYATKSTVGELEVDIEKVNTLLAGSVSAESGQYIVLNSKNTVIENNLVKNEMVESLSFGKITGIDINTTKFTVHSNDGKSTWKDNTIQIKDSTRTRVQIGKDNQGDYNIYIWDKNGNLMFDPLGLTDKGVTREVIDNSNVKENAGIKGSKLDIDSVIREVNDNGTTTIKSSKIYFNEDKQTLDVVLNSMTGDIEANSTAINVANGNISSLITRTTQNEADIGSLETDLGNAKANITNLKNNYNSVKDTVDSHTQTIGQHTSSISNLTTTANNALTTAQNATKPTTYLNGNYTTKTYYEIGKGTKAYTSTSAVGSIRIYGSIGGWTASNNGGIDITCPLRDNLANIVVQQKESKIGTTACDIWITYDSGGIPHYYLVLSGYASATLYVVYNPTYFTLVRTTSTTAPTGTVVWKLSEKTSITDVISANVTTVTDRVATVEQSLDGFKTTVSNTYATKTQLNSVDGKFANYSTTTAMNSAIQQSASSIETKVSNTYTTKSDFNGVKTRVTNAESLISQNANNIALKVSKDGIISSINQTSEEVKIQANKIKFEGLVTANNNFMILSDGSIKAVNGEFSGMINAESGTIAGWIISNDEISTIRVMRKTYRLDKEDEETSIYLEYHDDVLVSAKDNDGNSLMSNGELTVDLSNYAIFTEDEEISKITKNGFYSYNDRYDYEYYPPNDDSGMVNVNAGKLKGHNDYISELTIDKGVITLVGHDGYKYANQIGGSAPDYNLTIHSKKIISDCTYQTSGREVQNTIDFSDEKMTLKSSKKNFYSGEVIGESYISISEEVLLESSVGGRILINPQGNEQYVGCMYIDTPDYVRIGGGGDVTANKLYLYEDKANFNGTDFRVNNNRLPYKTTSVTVKIGAHSANGIDSKTVTVSNAVSIAGWNANGTGSSGLVLNRISCSGSSLYLEFRCILATDSTTEVVVYYRNY